MTISEHFCNYWDINGDQGFIVDNVIHTIAAHNKPLHAALCHTVLSSLDMLLRDCSCTGLPYMIPGYVSLVDEEKQSGGMLNDQVSASCSIVTCSGV